MPVTSAIALQNGKTRGDRVQKTISKSRRSRQQLELATLELEEIIVQLEIVSRQKRSQYLTDRASSS